MVPAHSGAVFMRGGNPNTTGNNRGKQGRSIYTPAKRLLGASPNKQILQVFAEAKSGKSLRVYHETLLATIKNG